ncbi:MAG: PEP-CTERM sorting domain-containing protein [Candidatus Nealsonbacteria bacterium]|nr:PEP-CTERM sorting domain-containing protein [Candidatus Nealsonbacteria bacterium]
MIIWHRISTWRLGALAVCIAVTTICAVFSTRSTWASPTLSPGVSVVQLSDNGSSSSYRGYPQVSGDGSTVYLILGYSPAGVANGQDLMRWRAGQPLETIVTLETQRWDSSISRPSTNYDGTRVSYRSRFDPQFEHVSPSADSHLFLYEEGTGIRDVFGDPRYAVYEPMMTPDGSTIFFSTTSDVDGVNPRHETIGCRYDVADEAVTPVLTFAAASTSDDANKALWRGVSNTDRQLMLSNGNHGGLNPENRAAYFTVEQGEPELLEKFTAAHYVATKHSAANLRSQMSADGRHALFNDVDENVHLIDLVTGELTTMPFTVRQRDFVISGNGDYVFYANRQTPISLFRWDRATGSSELLLTQEATYIDWQLSTDFSGNHLAFRSPNDLTGGNPDHQYQVFLMTVPEPSTFILLAAGAFGLLAYGWRRRRNK